MKVAERGMNNYLTKQTIARTDRQFCVTVIQQKRTDRIHAEANLVAVQSSCQQSEITLRIAIRVNVHRVAHGTCAPTSHKKQLLAASFQSWTWIGSIRDWIGLEWINTISCFSD